MPHNDERLDDVEVNVLASAVRAGIHTLTCSLDFFTTKDREEVLKHKQEIGRRGIESGRLVRAVRQMLVSEMMATRVAALAIAPGGVRIADIVFCAAHYPGGTEVRGAHACPVCDPGAETQDLADVAAGSTR